MYYVRSLSGCKRGDAYHPCKLTGEWSDNLPEQLLEMIPHCLSREL
jgi:hypothetical protein